VRLAQRIAKHVELWTARGLNPGDVLVLVRQRGPLFEAIIRALKDAGVPVAGADRLVLTEHIAVMDLTALADCLLLEDDDLALASVLKSPLFGLAENQLFELAWNRKGSLRDALRCIALPMLNAVAMAAVVRLVLDNAPATLDGNLSRLVLGVALGGALYALLVLATQREFVTSFHGLRRRA